MTSTVFVSEPPVNYYALWDGYMKLCKKICLPIIVFLFAALFALPSAHAANPNVLVAFAQDSKGEILTGYGAFIIDYNGTYLMISSSALTSAGGAAYYATTDFGQAEAKLIGTDENGYISLFSLKTLPVGASVVPVGTGMPDDVTLLALDASIDAANYSDMIVSVKGTVVGDYEENAYVFKLLNAPCENLIPAAPVLDEAGSAVAIFISAGENGYVLPIGYLFAEDYKPAGDAANGWGKINADDLYAAVGIISIIAIIAAFPIYRARRRSHSTLPTVILRGVAGEFAGMEFPITDTVILGSEPESCNIIFTEAADIGDKHCRLTLSGGRVFLTDLGTPGGTFLADGTALLPLEPVLLEKNAEFYLGTPEQRFRLM